MAKNKIKKRQMIGEINLNPIYIDRFRLWIGSDKNLENTSGDLEIMADIWLSNNIKIKTREAKYFSNCIVDVDNHKITITENGLNEELTVDNIAAVINAINNTLAS